MADTDTPDDVQYEGREPVEGEEVGIDGENPVTPNNPPAKAVSEADRESFTGGEPISEFEPHQYPTASDSADGTNEPQEAPSSSDSKAAWVDYAVAKGATREEAEKSTKDDLQKAYGS